MSPELRQLRQAFADRIKRNPSLVSFFVVDTLHTARVRFAHESASVPANKTTPVGLGTSFSMFCQMAHDSIITEGCVLIVGGKGWKVGPVDPLSADCGLYGKRATLTKNDLLNTSKAITSLKIGAVSGVISGTNITVTMPSGTDVTALTPVIAKTGKMVTPIGAQDFTTDRQYVVTAEDLTTSTYTVKVVLV